jgi:hypothetical protein
MLFTQAAKLEPQFVVVITDCFWPHQNSYSLCSFVIHLGLA